MNILVLLSCYLYSYFHQKLSHSVMSDSWLPCGLQHARLPCPSPSPRACSNSCPSSWWFHPTISSSVIPFSSCLQSFSASGSFPMSQLFTWGGQSIGVSASESETVLFRAYKNGLWRYTTWIRILSLPAMQETLVWSPCSPWDSQESSPTKRGPLEKGMANHFSILALRTPRTVWKAKMTGHWKMNSPGWQVPNMLLEISGKITTERMKRRSQSKNNTELWMWLVMEVKSDAVKRQYCIGTWNVRFMNQGKLKAVKQEMARVKVNILGLSELKWTEMGEFNSDDHYIYYYGQESLRRNGAAIIVNKIVQNTAVGWNLKNDKWSLFISKANYSISQ